MHEKITVIQQSEILEQRRALTEVNNLMLNRLPDGTYPLAVQLGIKDNLVTKVKEDSMGNAVSHSFQPVGEYTTSEGETRRTFMWRGLGKTAMQVAESGFEYHWSDAAFAHVRYHVQEARRDERELKPNTWHIMIEPHFSDTDANAEVAKSEHMAATDAIRISHAATDKDSNVLGRNMVAILVSDIPLSAWVAMFRDENNIWGKSFDIQNADSSLGVMGLFDQLNLPLDTLPEGPVTLVEAVSHYITDEKALKSVKEQLISLREDQQKLDEEAERAATKWLEFEKAMTDSLVEKVMRPSVRGFVIQHQNQWPKEIAAMLKKHERGGNYGIDVELASELELAWQRINLSESAIVVGDKKALKSLSKTEIIRLQEEIAFIRTIEREPWAAAEASRMRTNLNREFAVAPIKIGGGCTGENKIRFNNQFDSPPDMLDSIISVIVEATPELQGSALEDRIGEKHQAVCRTDGCPSRPGETEVGGCDVCLKYCQPLYDANDDPMRVFGGVFSKEEAEDTPAEWLDFFKLKDLNVVEKELVTV